MSGDYNKRHTRGPNDLANSGEIHSELVSHEMTFGHNAQLAVQLTIFRVDLFDCSFKMLLQLWVMVPGLWRMWNQSLSANQQARDQFSSKYL